MILLPWFYSHILNTGGNHLLRKVRNMDKEEFILCMSMRPLIEYGQEMKKMMEHLDDETIAECLKAGGLKDVCTAIECAYWEGSF